MVGRMDAKKVAVCASMAVPPAVIIPPSHGRHRCRWCQDHLKSSSPTSLSLPIPSLALLLRRDERVHIAADIGHRAVIIIASHLAD